MLTAKDAIAMTNQNDFRTDAINYAIESMEQKIMKSAKAGKRQCIADFYAHPGGYKDFVEKYGEDNASAYTQYDVEKEVRVHFEKCGFTFKRITGEVSGGVTQDPYDVICW